MKVDLADACALIDRLRIENAEANVALKASEEAAAERASRDAERIAQLELRLAPFLVTSPPAEGFGDTVRVPVVGECS